VNFDKSFENAGGEFLTPPGKLAAKILSLKAFIFDWDGVFNNGVKTDAGGSPFSEIDSMGLNMLRFSYYLKFGFIPGIYIVTGENNPPALYLSQREHFQAVYLKAKVKTEALDHIIADSELAAQDIAFVFDDILDLGLAAETGTGFFVGRPANPQLNAFVRRSKLADYQTANEGGQNPVREICELCIATLDNYDEVVSLRVANDPRYQEYLEQRNQQEAAFYLYNAGSFEEYQSS
jgi:3-deoxy-D-manno-octulosonate 8-phosphate phosphatase (KDO 8-P phosphatase)